MNPSASASAPAGPTGSPLSHRRPAQPGYGDPTACSSTSRERPAVRAHLSPPHLQVPTSAARTTSFTPPAVLRTRQGARHRRADLRILQQLTDRDRLLIDLLADHEVLTTAQIAAAAFGSRGRAQHRALILHRMGVLERFRWSLPAGSQPWRYTLGPIGAAIAAAGRGADPPSSAALRRRILRLATNPQLEHLLGVNGFFTALHAHARTAPGTQLALWWSERRATAEFDRLAHPDGFGQWIDHGAALHFFLEHDMGSEPLRRLIDKFAGYADLATAGGPRGTVLFTLPTADREANLLRRLALYPPPVPVATTTHDRFTQPGSSPADPIWLGLSHRHRRKLAELAGPAS